MIKSMLSALLVTFVSSAAVDYSATGTSSFKTGKNADGLVEYTSVNTTFEIANLFEGESLKPYLLKASVQRTTFDSAEGIQGQLAMEARTTQTKPFDQLAWKIQDDSDGFSVSNDLVLVWKSGCCGSATTYRAHDLRTGAAILSYDERTGQAEGAVVTPFILEVPNTSLVRYIGLLSGDATRDFQAETLNGQAKVATLTYARRDGKIKAIDIYATIPEGWGASVESQLVDLSASRKNEVIANRMQLWNSDGLSNPTQAFQGFGVKITILLENSLEISIPFQNDLPDLARATVPAGARLIAR